MTEVGTDDDRAGDGAGRRVPSVLGRAFDLLQVLERADGPLGLSDIAARSGLPKATTFRLLAQLVEERAVTRKGELYTLGMRMFALGASVRVLQRLQDVALPVLAALPGVDALSGIDQVAHLGVLDAGTVLQLQRVAGGPRSRRSAPSVRRPLHATALGKALLAQISDDEVRRLLGTGRLPGHTRFTHTDPVVVYREVSGVQDRGIAVEHDEWRIGFCAVAAPIGTLSDGTVAAIALAGRHGRFDPGGSAETVRSAASRIAELSGATLRRAAAGNRSGPVNGPRGNPQRGARS